MIVLDTNVVSEAMKARMQPKVQAWLDAQAAPTLYLSSVSLAELWFGIAALPAGQRRDHLKDKLARIVALFEQRVLVFDSDAARAYADRAAAARSRGQGFPVPDAYIAAIAAANGFKVATRDTAPFEAAGLTVINPWANAQ